MAWSQPGTLVIGDVHGCADELSALVDDVRPDRVILVGDCFTKGPDPAGVWTRIASDGWDVVLGNHDQRLLAWLDGKRPGDAEARRCVASLDAADGGWRASVRSWPLFLEASGWTVVHAGLHPSGSLEQTTREMALTMRRWPTGAAGQPHWHEVYTGDRRVVFGHDAVRGLVRVEREGQPWLIGLDSGCVYGGALSGYLLAEDRLVQVQAARAYRPVG